MLRWGRKEEERGRWFVFPNSLLSRAVSLFGIRPEQTDNHTGRTGSLGWGRREPRAPGQAYLPAQFCWDPDDTPGLAEGSRSTDPHLGAVLGDKEELSECAMQGQEDASLGHVLKQAVLHLGEELPQGLQQREVTEVAVGGGGAVSWGQAHQTSDRTAAPRLPATLTSSKVRPSQFQSAPSPAKQPQIVANGK